MLRLLSPAMGGHHGCCSITETPEVSIVIPTYDRWPLLSTNALPSALGQEQVRFEIIVVDDGSTDGTATRLRSLDEPRLRVIKHEQSYGVAAARNSGIATARGECVAFLDDDDLWSPLKLRSQLDVLRSYGSDYVYSDIVVVDERGDGGTYRLLAPEAEELAAVLLTRYVIPGGLSNVMARTNLVRSISGFDEQLSMTADWDYLIRLAGAGTAARCPGTLIATTVHACNMAIRSSWDELWRDFDHFVGKHRPAGLAIDEPGYARWLAVQRHRGGKTRDAALRLLALSLRFRRSTWALESLSWLRKPPGDTRSTTFGGDRVPEPSWLSELRRGTSPAAADLSQGAPQPVLAS